MSRILLHYQTVNRSSCHTLITLDFSPCFLQRLSSVCVCACVSVKTKVISEQPSKEMLAGRSDHSNCGKGQKALWAICPVGVGDWW